MSAIIRQLIALSLVFLFYSEVYGVFSPAAAALVFSKVIVEIFLLVLLFYGVYFIGKVFVWYWRRVDPKPKFAEALLITTFEYVYLPIVAICFPIFVENSLLNFEMINSKVNFVSASLILLVLIVLIDSSGKIRSFIQCQNSKIRERSLLQMEDIYNSKGVAIERSSLIFYFIGYFAIGVISFL